MDNININININDIPPIQQGDVTLTPCILPPGNYQETIVRPGDNPFPLVLGEGHHVHALRPVGEGVVCKVLVDGARRYIQIEGGVGELAHTMPDLRTAGEHGSSVLHPITYNVGQVLEYDYDTEEARYVAD